MASRPLITAAMIVRDEEHHLGACLDSLEGVADEVVIVDTGSVDGTVALALARGAQVHHLPWQGDFAAARNHALEHAGGRWILYVDADERLRPVDRGALEQLLAGADEVAFRVWLRPEPRATPYREYRLWRNDPRIRFRGVIHEKVHPAIVEVAGAEGRPIGDCDLELDHVGYEGDQSAKHRRNLPLLEAQLAVEPDNIFNWRHLAEVRRGLGDAGGAEAALRRAVEIARASWPPDEHGSLAYGDLLWLLHGRGEPVEALTREARERYPDNWMLVWIEARHALEDGRHEEALAALERLIAVDHSTLPDTIAYDERIFGAFAHASRGLILLRLGRCAEAAAAYRAAERCEPEDLELRVKRQLAEARAARSVDRPDR